MSSTKVSPTLGDIVNIHHIKALAQIVVIAISKVIYDYVRGKTQYEFNDFSVQKIKQNEFALIYFWISHKSQH